jgi:hypothetical protein
VFNLWRCEIFDQNLKPAMAPREEVFAEVGDNARRKPGQKPGNCKVRNDRKRCG